MYKSMYKRCIEIERKWILLKKKKEIILRKEEICLRYWCTRDVLKLEESGFF